ncbi:M23 family metallopeptidase [Methanoregula formicica]|uniref:Metalloendopeptidase-like membrane protein n=1 Tax=Methanoregula formicica (strain DSM 22288 / NBRC 105244 / SMSP) TaxID=593750 RepID=L0HCZ3_METFS|nr:M23 family metallopeptidase [Methanoregula formicica]AGB01163.1 metalloendopeptidase-like membrane protein [Methanoregula formicica SMSP]
MPRKSTFLFIVIVIAFLLAAGCTQSRQASSGQPPATAATAASTPPVSMAVPFGPIPVESMNGINIAYELEFSGMENMSFVPEKVEVLDAATSKVLYTPNSSVLARTSHPATSPLPTAADMQNGTQKILKPRISIWFRVAPGSVPDRLTHGITFNRTADGLSPLTVTGGDVTIRKDLQPVVVGSPVKGPGWAIMETTSPVVHHFTSQITMFNVTRVPQRYAQDYIYLDPATGKAFSGDMTITRNYYGFGKELYAVGDGTVVYTRDGIPDIEITTQKPAPSFDTALGNGVIIDLGNRKYACYGHMVNGSVRVMVGDTVTEGQVIGLMGNTGNSDAPHLHFQVITDNPAVLGGEGYPIVYRSFTVTGKFDEDNIASTFFNTPIPQQNRLMENDVVVSFP